MSSGLRLRRPVFFAGGLRCPVCLRRIALCPVFLPVFRLSLAGPCLPLPVSLSARISPALSGRPPSSVFRLVFFLSFLVFPFIVHRPPLVGGCPYPVPRRASFRCRSVRITAFVSAESRPACLRELLAVSFRSGFRRSVFPQKCVRPPYLGRRAVSDKITPCILLSGAIFPARPAILLTIWQRLPFGTTFVQIQGVTGAPDPQGGRTPAARKENGKNINN